MILLLELFLNIEKLVLKYFHHLVLQRGDFPSQGSG